MNLAEQMASDLKTSPSFVVGIGASAGGLESLEKLFQNLPADTGMAFVIIQHLSLDKVREIGDEDNTWTFSTATTVVPHPKPLRETILCAASRANFSKGAFAFHF